MRKITIFTFFLVGILVCSIKASAYVTCGYKLTGTWQNQNYFIASTTVSYNGTTKNYGTIGNSAVSAWNNAVNAGTGHPLDIALTAANNSDSPSTRVVIQALNRGDVSWRGLTYYFIYNSIDDEWYYVNYGDYPNQDYTAGTAVINIHEVHGDPDWKIQNTMMHEIGHIFGLKHSYTNGAIMYEYSQYYTSLKTPHGDDVNGVRDIYE